jgi:hypothetical protein
MRLLAELERKVADPNTDEVHELQPIFEKGLCGLPHEWWALRNSA